MLSYRLRHRVHIQYPDEAQDEESGEMVTTWKTLKVGGRSMSSVPAEVLTGPGRESRGSQAVQAETDARINMRWFPGLDQTMRILWDGRIYNIGGMATDVTGRKEWRLTCAEGVNDG